MLKILSIKTTPRVTQFLPIADKGRMSIIDADEHGSDTKAINRQKRADGISPYRAPRLSNNMLGLETADAARWEMAMEKTEIFNHWTDWASTFGTDLRATSKTWTIKALEIDALARGLDKMLDARTGRVLEVGCGNGINCVELAERFPDVQFDGIDFVPEMIDSASKNATVAGVSDRVRFFAGDVLKLEELDGLRPAYNAILTDRCLINLNTLESQKSAITALVERLLPGGSLLMIENSIQNYTAQNSCREALDLDPRVPAEFNLFFDDEAIRNHVEEIGIELLDIEDFGSLHDLMLYVLVPAINGGDIDYDHELVAAATRLTLELNKQDMNNFGPLGQNRMYVCRRPA